MYSNNTLPAEYLHLSNIPGHRLQLIWNLWPKCSDLSFYHENCLIHSPQSHQPQLSAAHPDWCLQDCPRHSDAQFSFCRRDSSEDWWLWQSSMRKIHCACHLLWHGRGRAENWPSLIYLICNLYKDISSRK